MKAIVTLSFLIISFNFFSQSKEAKDSLNYAIDLLNNGVNFSNAKRILLKYENEIQTDTNGLKFYITLSSINGSQGRTNEAIHFANKAMALSVKNNNFFKLEIDNLLGSIHNFIGDYEQGVFYLKQTLNKGNVADIELTNYEDIIQAYLKLNKPDSARIYADLALNSYSKNGKEYTVFNQKLYRIKVLKEKSKSNNQSQIIKLIKEGIDKGLLNKNADNYANIALCYQELKEYNASISYYNKAVNLSTLSMDTLMTIEIYQKMIELYDSIGDRQKKEEIILQQYKYKEYIRELDKTKYRDLVLLYNKINSKPKKNRNLFVAASSIFMFLVFISLLFWLRKKKTQSKTTKPTQISIEVIEKIRQGLKESENNKDYLNPDFNMSFLENKIGVNRKYIGIFLKEEGNLNLTIYTNILRIKYAESRMKDANDPYKKYTIEHMASEVGYKTAITFKKHMKEYSDITLD